MNMSTESSPPSVDIDRVLQTAYQYQLIPSASLALGSRHRGLVGAGGKLIEAGLDVEGITKALRLDDPSSFLSRELRARAMVILNNGSPTGTARDTERVVREFALDNPLVKPLESLLIIRGLIDVRSEPRGQETISEV